MNVNPVAFANLPINWIMGYIADLLRGTKVTYCATFSFTPPATPTDMVTIYGSNTKLVRVQSVRIGTTNTAAGSQKFTLVKRSAVNTGGTFVAAAAVPNDSTDPAATAVVGNYTVNPAGLGAAVGNLRIVQAASPVAVPGSFASVVQLAEIEMLPTAADVSENLKDPVLNNANEGLAINFGGAALVAGQTHTATIVWTEE